MTPLANPRRLALIVAFVVAFVPIFGRAQAPQSPSGTVTRAGAPDPAPKAISLEDYPRFKRIAEASISTDGK